MKLKSFWWDGNYLKQSYLTQASLLSFKIHFCTIECFMIWIGSNPGGSMSYICYDTQQLSKKHMWAFGCVTYNLWLHMSKATLFQ